ncbi:MAG TPA: CBS domain-containing protein [Dehalococcoidia bacterium]|nr:CBS domain-containing protein [Dehalococcoidia bacterium]
MLRGGIPLGRVFGISLKLNYTWFIIFALVTWSLTVYYFPDAFPEWSTVTSLVAGIITSLLFFCSVLAHELMHSIVAQKLGIPVHSITLFVFGGVSQMSEEPKTPKDELRIALAGPLTSIALGLIFGAIWYWLNPQYEFVLGIAFWLFWINLALAAFNLIPGFPLDGGRVLRSILWWRNKDLQKATKIASNIGRGVGYLFIFGGVFLVFQGLWINGFWLALIGWFLENAAVGSYQQVALLGMLQGHTAREVMTRDCPAIPPGLTLDELVNEHVLTTGRRCFPVTTDSRVLGLVTLSDIRAVPRSAWPTKRVSEAMTPLEKMKSVSPDDDLSKVLRYLTEGDINQVVVLDNGDIAGVIGRDNLLSFINLRGELGA